jgi:hypothetical protein
VLGKWRGHLTCFFLLRVEQRRLTGFTAVTFPHLSLPLVVMAALPPMRTGGFLGADVPDGPLKSVETMIILVVKEAYKLAAKHTRLSGRTIVQTEDVERALKVVVHPSYEFVDRLQVPTHAGTVGDDTPPVERGHKMLAMEFCGRLAAGGTFVNSQGQLQLADRPEFQGSEETYSFASDEDQLQDNSLFLMWHAHKHFDELVALPNAELSPMRRALIRGIAAMTAAMEAEDDEEYEALAELSDEADEEDEGRENTSQSAAATLPPNTQIP